MSRPDPLRSTNGLVSDLIHASAAFALIGGWSRAELHATLDLALLAAAEAIGMKKRKLAASLEVTERTLRNWRKSHCPGKGCPYRLETILRKTGIDIPDDTPFSCQSSQDLRNAVSDSLEQTQRVFPSLFLSGKASWASVERFGNFLRQKIEILAHIGSLVEKKKTPDTATAVPGIGETQRRALDPTHFEGA
jgi:hypothetical protein